MIYECFYCKKLHNEDDGIMVIQVVELFFGVYRIYVFRCKNCMTEKGKKAFEEFKKKNEK